MNYFTFINKLITLFCVTFTYAQNQDLKLEIVNTEILSKIDINNQDYKNIYNYNDNYIYDSIPNNKINIRITNNGSKTFVFSLNQNIYNESQDWNKNVTFSIFDRNDKSLKAKPIAVVTESLNSYDMRSFRNEAEAISLYKELYKQQYKDTTELYKLKFQKNINYIIIHPNETKFFTYYQSLPHFRNEIPSFSSYFLNHKENYTFQLIIKNNANINEEYFSENLKKEIEENGYEIFDGEIKSNIVPIKFVKM